MTDMVEKVARALAAMEFGDADLDKWMQRPSFGDDYRRLARAAIEAMREPDDGMLAAFNNVIERWMGSEGADGEVTDADVVRAIIDAALKGSGE